jgi:CRP/FNR family cyclic AMP-dependent transcriptional regulator
MDPSEIQNIIENCELFKGLNTIELEGITKLSQVEMYEAGDKIFNQGNFSDKLYIIAEGHVFLERSIDLGKRKGNVTLSLLGRGRALGCWSTLLGEVYPLMSSAICKEHTKVVVMRGPALREMILSDFHLGFKVMERLCSILRDTLQGAYGAMEKI